MNDSLNADFNNKQNDEFKLPKRSDTDKLSICLDANKWTVTWFMNDKQIGKPFKVMENETYHLFISSNCYHNDDKQREYHLIVDY